MDELYKADSSCNYLPNINVPMVFINSKDDPLVHPSLLAIPEGYATTHPNSMYIETEHGGHLGFYDGGYVCPEAVTWIDKMVVSVVTALANRDTF